MGSKWTLKFIISKLILKTHNDTILSSRLLNGGLFILVSISCFYLLVLLSTSGLFRYESGKLYQKEEWLHWRWKNSQTHSNFSFQFSSKPNKLNQFHSLFYNVSIHPHFPKLLKIQLTFIDISTTSPNSSITSQMCTQIHRFCSIRVSFVSRVFS